MNASIRRDVSPSSAASLCCALPGADRPLGRCATPAAAAARRSTKTYPLKGVVRKVDPAAGVVTIRHEAIPGFMAAMTMPFTSEGPASLDDVRPGDEVEGPLAVVRGGDGQGLRPRRPDGRPSPPPQALTLDLVGGAADAARRSRRSLEPGEPVPDFAMTTQDGEAAEALRPARQGRRADIHLHAMPAARLLPGDGPEVRRAGRPARGRRRRGPSGSGCSRSASTPSTTRPRSCRKHAERPGGEAAALDLRRGLARGAAQGRRAARPGLRADAETRSSTTSRTAVIGPDGTLARLEVGRRGEVVDAGETCSRRMVTAIPGRADDGR